MKYTRSVALTATALMLAALTACGGAGKMPEDPEQALAWAVENYTNGNGKDVAKAIPPRELGADDYTKAIGNHYVTEESKCQADPDTTNGHERPGGVIIHHTSVSCESVLPKGESLDGRPTAQFKVGPDGQPYDFQFKDVFG